MKPISHFLPTGREHNLNRAGFTLVELLLALGIMAIVAVIVLGGFRVGARIWEKASVGLDREQRTRAILMRLRNQLVALDLASMHTTRKETLLVGGDGSTLGIVTHTSLLRQSDQGPYYSLIEVESPAEEDAGSILRITEIPLVIALDGETDDPLEDRPGRVVFTGIYRMKFEYLQILETDFTWEPQWHPHEDDWTPKALRFQFQWEEKKPPVEIIVAFPHQQTRLRR